MRCATSWRWTWTVAKDMPPDDTGYGFDNIADVLTVSPTLMDRYITVAGKIGRMATGMASRKRVIATDYKVPKDLFINGFGVAVYNERASDDLPLDFARRRRLQVLRAL